MVNQLIVAWLWHANYWGMIMISELRWYNYDKQTMVVRLQQENYNGTIMIEELLWYNYDKLCFSSFKEERKERKGVQKS